MRRTACGLLLVLTTLAGWAQEPILRVIDLKTAPGPAVAQIQHRAASDKGWFDAFVGTTGALRDHFKTSKDTVAALEFFIGGRVGVNKDTEVEIVSERSVAERNLSIQRIMLHSGAIWLKSGKLKKPLEIQTNGGTMAIKGTEFTLETSSEATQLNVLEGSVEVQDAQRRLLALAEPGDSIQLTPTAPPRREHKDPAELRRQIEQSPLGEAIALVREELQGVQEDLNRVRNLSEQLDEALNALEKGNKIHLAPPYQKAILKPTTNDSVQGLDPSSPVGGISLFQWRPYPQADGYVIFVSAQPDFSNILFSARTRDATAVYPASARPLAPGRYYWRVVPVDAQDQPLNGATQATFQVLRPG